MTAQDGHVTSDRPGLPARRTFTAAYKARILAEFDALPEGSPERGALLRKERPGTRHPASGTSCTSSLIFSRAR